MHTCMTFIAVKYELNETAVQEKNYVAVFYTNPNYYDFHNVNS